MLAQLEDRWGNHIAPKVPDVGEECRARCSRTKPPRRIMPRRIQYVLDEGSAGDSAPGGKTNEESGVDSQVRETTKIDDDHSDALVSVGDNHVGGSNGQLETYSMALQGMQSCIGCVETREREVKMIG